MTAALRVDLVDTLAARVALRRLPASPLPVLLPDADVAHLNAEHLGDAEGQSFVIAYADESGRESVRRITVWSIKRGAAGVPLLVAKCHERQRTVTFRVDRIRTCIDFDGQVFDDVPAFLFETFGMPLDIGARTAARRDQEEWDAFRARFLPHLVLLAALSHADERMVPDELGVAVDYCAANLRRMGGDPSEAFCRIAASYIARLRPRREDLVRAIDAMMGEDPDAAMTFLQAAARLVDADGRRHPAEIAMLNDLANDLIGVDVL